MELGEMVIIILQITTVISKKRIKLRDDSIENVLYYKDCNHKPKAPILRSNPPQQECKMCCTMCCGDQCKNNQEPQRSLPADVTQPEPQIQPQPPHPFRKANLVRNVPPIAMKTDFNTRGYIKNLISHDGDIKSILKDLVRVTMEKVNLMKKINIKNSNAKETLEESKDYEADL